LIEAAGVLRALDVRITGLDYRAVFEELGSNDFAYVDPPYFGCDVRAYKAAGVNHQEVAGLLRFAPFGWLLSEYSQPIYECLGDPISRREYTLKCSGKLVAAESRSECLWAGRGTAAKSMVYLNAGGGGPRNL
jgi:site-specific DNA-adenine methylase